MKYITRKKLNSYLKKKKYKNLTDFLFGLQASERLRIEFSTFAGVKLVKEGSTFLFHGSKEKFSTLSPAPQSRPQDKYVYATSNPDYGIFLAIIDLKNASAGVTCSDTETQLTVDSRFVNGNSKFIRGYLHIVSSENFKKRNNSEFISSKEAPVLVSFQVEISDLSVSVLITG